MFSRMKKITLFIFLLVLSSNLFAQLKPLTTYPNVETEKTIPYDWKEVDKFKNNGLPRKAIDAIIELQEKAIKEKNVVTYLESFEKLNNVVYKAKFDNEEEENFYWDYAEQASKIPFPFNNITYLYVGKQVNRLFYRGSLGMDDESKTWSIHQQKITFKNNDLIAFNKAILESIFDNLGGLMSVNISRYKKGNKKEQPQLKSLFEYLSQEVLNQSRYFSSEKKQITSTDYHSTINKLPFNKEDLTLQLYYLLENLTFNLQRFDDYSFWAEKRINYVYNNSSHENINDFNKDSLHLESIKEHEDLLAENPASARFSLLIVKQYIDNIKYNEALKDKDKNNYVLALKTIEKVLAKYPENNFLNELIELKNYIKNDEVSFYLKTELIKGKASLLNVKYRNIQNLTFKIYKIENDKPFKNPKNEISNYDVSTIFSKVIYFPEETAYLEHDMDFILPKLKETGKYIFIIGENERAIDSLFSAKNLYEKTNFSYKIYKLSNLKAFTTIRDGQLHFLVNDAISGKPVSNAEIIVTSKDNQNVTLLTGKDGKTNTSINNSNSLTYTISKGGDELDGRAYFYGNRNATTVYSSVFLDRRIYRPGQTVKFKAIHYQNDSISNVLSNQLINLEVKDRNQKSLYKKGFTTNEFGSIDGSFSLPKNGFILGNMSVYINGSYETSFNVEEYKIPTFEVLFDEVEGNIKLGDTLSITGKATAYAGYPISNALVYINVSQSNYFPRWCVPNSDMESDYFTVEVKTNDKGEFTFNFLPKADKFLFGSYFTIDAAVTDINGEVQETNTSLYVGKESYQISALIPDQVLSSATTQFLVKVENSQYVEQRGKTFNYTLEKINQENWKPITIEESEFKDFTEKEFNKAFPFVAYYKMKINPNIIKWDTLSSNEKLDVSKLVNNTPGRYQLTLSTPEPNGENAMLTKTFNYISSDSKKKQHKEDFWVSSTNNSPEIGETVSIMVGSAHKKLYVFQELTYPNGKIESKWFKLKGRKTIQIPITNKEIGVVRINFYTSILSESFNEQITINTIDKSKEIKVELATERDFLTPGEEEKWTMTLKQENDSVPNAELLVSMYDKALDNFTNNDWSTHFKEYSPRISTWSNVYANKIPNSFNGWGNDYDNRYDVFDSEEKIMYNSVSSPSFDSVEKSMEVKEDSETISDEKETTPRTNFAETAFFYPSSSINKKGESLISFTTPDALTTWKFRAFVHSKDLSSGSFNKEFIAKKEIIVQPNAPRFLREKDQFIFASKVVNNSEEDQEILVKLKFKNPTDDADISSDFGNFEPKTITVKANSSELVEWKGTVSSDKHQLVAYYISAKGTQFQDAEQKLLPILSNRVLVTKTMPFVYTTTETKEIHAEKLLDLNTTAVPVKLHLEIQSQPLWSALMSIPSLINEEKNADAVFSNYFAASYAQKIINENPLFQKMIEIWQKSNPKAFESALEQNEDLKQLILSETPWLLDAKNESERRSKLAELFNENNLQNLIETNLQALKKLQQANGGWGWYDVQHTNVNVTQAIVLGLGQMKEIGLAIDKNIATKAINYLDNHYNNLYTKLSKEAKKLNQGCSDMHVQWLIARDYFNSPKNESVGYYQSCLNQQWTNRNLHLQALIGLNALANNNETLANKIKASLLDRASSSPEMGMYWNRNSNGYNWSESTIATQASLIEFFNKFENEAAHVEAMKLFLLQQKQATAWNSNKATVAACYALTIGKNTTIPMHTFAKIGENEFSGEITEGVNNTFDWNGNAIHKNKTQLELTKKEEGVVFGSYYLQYLEDLDKVTKTNEALRVQKHYYFSKGGKEVELKANDTVSVGTKITVKISVKANRDMDFVHLKDSKGMGCEAQKSLSVKNWNKSAYYLVERDASTSFFIDALSKGTHNYTYDFFITSKGKVHFGPAIVESNYAPSLKANSNGFVIVSE